MSYRLFWLSLVLQGISGQEITSVNVNLASTNGASPIGMTAIISNDPTATTAATNSDTYIEPEEKEDENLYSFLWYNKAIIEGPPPKLRPLIMRHEGVEKSVVPVKEANSTFPGNWGVLDELAKTEHNATVDDEYYQITCYCMLHYRCLCSEVKNNEYMKRVPIYKALIFKPSIDSRVVIINGTLDDSDFNVAAKAHLTRTLLISIVCLFVIFFQY